MADFIWMMLNLLMNVFIGGWGIGFAVQYFIRKQYIRFGIQVMFTVSFILFMVRIICVV